ncbi:hypothetical protein SPONN_1474 [uncultured Candidatus Thioglobus sp.]|nr:hypothetical protein SPONN_1474 [uncultured Candidatus Thioglobus sp.]
MFIKKLIKRKKIMINKKAPFKRVTTIDQPIFNKKANPFKL